MNKKNEVSWSNIGSIIIVRPNMEPIMIIKLIPT